MKVFPIYIHVEKCGGMSLHHALRYTIPSYQILRPWWYWSNEPGNYLTEEELARFMKLYPGIAGIGGHTTRTYAGYERVVSKPLLYFTFLRDPVARYLSHLNHQVNKMGVNWSVDGYLNEPRFSNFITRRIAGADDINLAKRTLQEDFSFVGMFERFDESAVLLSQLLFGVPHALHYEHMNDSTFEKKITYKDLTETQKKRLEKNVALDCELYDFARNVLYENQRKGFVGDLRSELVVFSEKNSAFRYNPMKWRMLGIVKLYSDKVPQRIAHMLS